MPEQALLDKPAAAPAPSILTRRLGIVQHRSWATRERNPFGTHPLMGPCGPYGDAVRLHGSVHTSCHDRVGRAKLLTIALSGGL